MSTKLLLAAFALLAVANAVDVYLVEYADTACSGNNPERSVKVTLGQCTYDADLPAADQHSRLTLTGGKYTWTPYPSGNCASSPNPGDAGEPGTAVPSMSVDYCYLKSGKSAKILLAGSTADYMLTATNSYDCTSGSCTSTASNSACKCSSAPCIRTKS